MRAHQETVSVDGEVLPLGVGADAQTSTLSLRGKDGGAWNGSVTLRGRIPGGGIDAVPIGYVRRYLAAGVSDDTRVSTPISDTDFLIQADITGLEADLLVDVTAGELDLEWVIVHGK